MLKKAVLALSLSAGLVAPVTNAHAAGNCRFVLGFASLASQLPQQVGQCADDEAHNPANGDALQHTTTGGLLVWRKADNWTAFTDGYHTWVNGPDRLQERLNTDRFPWEAPDASPPASPAPSPSPSSGSILSTPVVGGVLTQDQVDAVSVPDGEPAMSTLSSAQQVACYHMAQDFQKAGDTGQPTAFHGDSFSCPYMGAVLIPQSIRDKLPF
ncbi:MAG TPA: hypothetical protein VFS62_08090 [Chloroflexota bacterium]|nr:hypothetical protein [Chloroflexota bacterium]